MTLKYPVALRNTRLNSVVTAAGTSAKLIIYPTPRAADADTATGLTPIVTLTCNVTQFGTVTGGVLTVSAITTANATATGTPIWFRITNSAGTTTIVDGDCGASGSDLNLGVAAINSGQPVSISSFTITEGNA